MADARAADPLRPITFAAPSRIAALAMRRDLARRTPHTAVRFETLPRLAELAGSGELAASGLRPLARPIGDYAAGVVAKDAGGVFAGVARLPGYARVLRRHFQRLRRGGIRRSRDLRAAPDGPATHEFLRAYDAFRDLLAPFYDDEDLFDAAAAAVRAGHAGIAADLGDIYLVPPGPRTAGGDAFVRALAASGAPLHELTGDPVAHEPTYTLHPDPASEAEAAARAVLRLLETGASLHEVAVFHGGDRAYAPLLAGVFDRAGIPAARAPGRPLTESPAGRAALALLQLPAHDYSRVAVFDFFALAQAPATLTAGGGTVRLQPTTWDRLSRDAGVTHGTERWQAALAAFAADARRRAATEDDAGWRARHEVDAATVESLAMLVHDLAAMLEPLRASQPAAAFIERLKRAVTTLIRPDSDGFAEVVDEIDQLGTVAAIGGSFDLAAFTTAFEANLRAATTRDRGLGEGVLIADYRAAAGLAFPHVIVCGAYEGSFPLRATVEPVVDDAWWALAHAAHPFIEDTATRLRRDRDAALRCLASATQSLSITIPLASSSGTREHYPSPVVAGVVSSFAGGPVTASELRRRGTPGSPLASAVTGPALDAFEQELRQAISSRQAGIWTAPAGHRLALPVALRRARREPRLTEWDGLVDLGEPLLAAGRQLSPTSIEQYATCGFRFFLRSILRLDAPEDPEERQTMDSATRGTIVHAVLEQFFKEQLVHGRPALGEAWTAADRERLLQILEDEMAVAEARGQVGLPIFHRHELLTLRADLERFLGEDSTQRLAFGAIPSRFEQPFDAVEIGGHLFRGSPDRIDRSADGSREWVIDYKTGSSKYHEISAEDPFRGGTQLQLGVYAEALAREARAAGRTLDVTGLYWFITRRGEFRALEYDHSAANAVRLGEIVGAIGGGIERGVFPAIPGDEDRNSFANCKYCDFDRVCSRRRLADATRRAGDDTVAPWANVAEIAKGARQ